MKKTVTIFGSSLPKPGDSEYETAYILGKTLAENNLNICSGGNQGIMDAVSKGAVKNGTEAIGVTVEVFNAVPSSFLTKKIICMTLFERIDKLIELGDAYIILAGGTGTLLELSALWEFFNKKLIEKKPVACHGSMWENLINGIESRLKFEGRKTGIVKYFSDIDRCANYIVSSLKPDSK